MEGHAPQPAQGREVESGEAHREGGKGAAVRGARFQPFQEEQVGLPQTPRRDSGGILDDDVEGDQEEDQGRPEVHQVLLSREGDRCFVCYYHYY